MDWKLELAVVPVSDVDRAKPFYLDNVGFCQFSDPAGNGWLVQQVKRAGITR